MCGSAAAQAPEAGGWRDPGLTGGGGGFWHDAMV